MKLSFKSLYILSLALIFNLALSSSVSAEITYSLHLDNVNADIATQISNSVRDAVGIYNSNGRFDKHLNVYYSSGVPTAQANYDGVMTFGNSRNTRVAIHEISHTLGVGTQSAYWNLMSGGEWYGPATNALLSEFEGTASVLHGDSQHIWPYGLNYDSEDSYTNRIRHVRLVEAMRCDMGIGPCEESESTDPGFVLEGSNRVIFNRASGKVLDAYGNSNGANLIIYSDYATPNQRWNIVHHGNGEYSFRSMQNAGRAMDTWNWGTSNGTNIALYSYWGGGAQRFYIEEVEPGWYRITPVIAPNQCVDAYGTGNADNVGTWAWWGGENQQWGIR